MHAQTQLILFENTRDQAAEEDGIVLFVPAAEQAGKVRVNITSHSGAIQHVDTRIAEL